jgi:hypothetical protein
MTCSNPMASRSERELWRLAQTVVLEHGAEAPVFAAARAGHHLRMGEIEGTHIWCIVVRRASILLQRSIRTVN